MLSKNELQYLEWVKEEVVNKCSKCHGTGIMCTCWETFLLASKQTSAHIPANYHALNLEDITYPESQGTRIEIAKYISKLKDVRRSGTGLYLWSETKGTGKTAFGSIILTAAIKAGYSTYFTTLGKCMDLIVEGSKNDQAKNEFKEILERDFLMIDDIGMEGGANFRQTTLTTIFKERSGALLPTILTSNINPDNIEKEFGERFLSSLYEFTLSLECKGTDFRKTALKPELRKMNDWA